MSWLDFLFDVPYSMLFILLVNTCIVLVGSLVFRRMVNIHRLETQEFEVHSHDRNLREAKRKNDQAVLRKLKREEIRIKRISSTVSKQRLKAGTVTILPFAVTSIVFNILYTGRNIVLFPFDFFLFNNKYSFSLWYFLTYLVAYLPLSRIFRTSPSFWQPSSERKSR